MIGITITAPAPPVLTAADMRLQGRIDETAEDALLDDYIAAAQAAVILHAGRPAGTTGVRMTMETFPLFDLWLPLPRLVSLDAVTYTDADAVEVSLDVNELQVDADSEPARVRPWPGTSWPSASFGLLQPVKVDFTVTARADTLPIIRQAVRLSAATWYEHRESVTEGRVSQLPDGVQRLLNTIRVRDHRLARFLTET